MPASTPAFGVVPVGAGGAGVEPVLETVGAGADSLSVVLSDPVQAARAARMVSDETETSASDERFMDISCVGEAAQSRGLHDPDSTATRENKLDQGLTLS